MQILINLVAAVLKVLLSVLFENRQPTAEDAQRQPELRKRLQAKVRRAGRTLALLAALSCVAAGGAGCGRTRTIYVPPGEPVRLRETIEGAKVWVIDKDGKAVAGRADLAEGWYCLPDPGTEDDSK